jgi:hypothetical protein
MKINKKQKIKMLSEKKILWINVEELKKEKLDLLFKKLLNGEDSIMEPKMKMAKPLDIP